MHHLHKNVLHPLAAGAERDFLCNCSSQGAAVTQGTGDESRNPVSSGFPVPPRSPQCPDSEEGKRKLPDSNAERRGTGGQEGKEIQDRRKGWIGARKEGAHEQQEREVEGGQLQGMELEGMG